MSTRSETYLVWGWQLPYTTYDYLSSDEQEKILDYERSKAGQQTIIVDGMNGGYVVVGIIMAMATDDGEGFSPPLNIGKLNPPEEAGLYDLVKQLEPNPGSASFILFTHYH